MNTGDSYTYMEMSHVTLSLAEDDINLHLLGTRQAVDVALETSGILYTMMDKHLKFLQNLPIHQTNKTQ